MSENIENSAWGRKNIKPEIDAVDLDWFELRDRFLIHLLDKPELHYHIDQNGDSQCLDNIDLVWKKSKHAQNPINITLEVAGDIKDSDGKSINYGFRDAEPTIVQIAKLVAEFKEPELIHYERFDTLWRISQTAGATDINKFEHHVADLDYAGFRDEILKAARSLNPNFANLSLIEIGKILKHQSDKK